jgi:hypothetical protein
VDRPLAAFHSQLLDLAFEAATAIPVDPHVNDRSRAQDAVVGACLELDQPHRALGYVEQIKNWRRGTGYADVAFYWAQHGDTSQMRRCLSLAGQIAEHAADWRKDRIRVRIARTHAWLGQTEQAAELEAGVIDAEAGKVDKVRDMRLGEEGFEAQLGAVDAVVATNNFDLMKNALEACAQLFDRFYEDPSRRSRVEEKIKSSWTRLPISIRIDLLIELAGFALDHKDQATALRLVNEAQALLDGSRWTAEHRVPLQARLAGLRSLAGDVERARTDADAALELFDAERERIVSVARADTLLAVAEAYQSMRDTAAALRVYRKAVDEGAANPNGRPRALDLSAACRSMALHAVEPDADLWARIHQIKGGLGQPW